ncbi:MAG: UvrD-helicase domain-containing protein [Flavihumibacter sp.]
MNDQPLHIYRASAGSGKTFLLASRYLLLLFEHPYKYREILAVTFTNKATEEMRTRILGELKKLAEGKDSLYAAIIREKMPALQGALLQQKADEIYRHILHDYSRFAVGTIDSFVQQIIRAFAFEIGLNAGYELQLNSELVKKDLAERLYALIDTSPSLLNWLIDLAEERIDAGKSWDFSTTMLELASEIFKERFALFEENLRRIDDPDAVFSRLRKKLKQQIDVFETDMKSFGAQGLAIIHSNGLSATDFKNGKKGFPHYFNKLVNGAIEAPKTTTLSALDEPAQWVTKTTPANIRDKIEAAYPALNAKLGEAIRYYQGNAIEYNTQKEVFRNIDNLNLLRVLADQLGDYRRETNSLLISDTHSLLRELTRDNDAPFIFEKTGSRYHHFLLDEFQDTSSFQWENFKPLLEQSIAAGHFNLLVGDVKQAIYRWRNGDWRLLLSEAQKGYQAEQVFTGSLQENYRSAPEIIAFNNAFFAAAPALLQQQFNADMQQLADDEIQQRLRETQYFSMITDAYNETEQTIPPGALPGGGISIRFFSNGRSRSNDWQEPAMEQLARDMETMIVDQQLSPGGIAVLTRNNHEARRIIGHLLQYQQQPDARCQYPILSADALQLDHSPAIQLLIAALSLLHNAGNKLARAELIQADAVRQQQNLSDPALYRINQETAREALPEAFYKKEESLRWASLFDATEALIGIFALDEWTSEQAFLLHFRDLVNNFSKNGKTTFREFLDWWNDDATNKALPSAGGVSAVQVMTIHKSKGLAFDAVLLPFASWELENNKGNIWCRYENDGPLEWVPVRLGAQLRQTRFAIDYQEEQLLSLMDALNLLYVAFTRARRQLRIYAPDPPASSAKISTVGALVAAVTGYTGRPASDYFAGVSFTESAWELPYTTVPAAVTAKTESISLAPRVATGGVDSRTDPAPENWLLETAASYEQTLGRLLHLALERIPHHRETGNVLMKMRNEGLLTDVQLPALREKLEKVWQQPDLAKWYKGDYKVISERPILLQGGAVRRPDKVFYNDEETILIDFKFTRMATTAHTKQLEEYRDLLAQMGFPAVQAYLYYGLQEALVPLQQLPRQQGNLFN